MSSLKICSKCKLEKPFDAFGKDKSQTSGLRPSCKDCDKVVKKAWLDNNRVKMNLYQVNYNKERKSKPIDFFKKCADCNIEKHSSEFNTSKHYRDFLNKCCKDCQTVRSRKPEILVKVCTLCKIEKDKDEFYKTKTGIQAKCKECTKAYSSKWYKQNKVTHYAKQKEWAMKPESRERRRLLSNTKYKPNRTHHSAYRRSLKMNATPKWLTKEQLKEIKNIYKSAKTRSEFHEIVFEVDHIEPLKGKNSCGLHVPWNLQVITSTENRSKSNKLIN